jgi:hypothetical protein
LPIFSTAYVFVTGRRGPELAAAAWNEEAERHFSHLFGYPWTPQAQIDQIAFREGTLSETLS